MVGPNPPPQPDAQKQINQLLAGGDGGPKPNHRQGANQTQSEGGRVLHNGNDGNSGQREQRQHVREGLSVGESGRKTLVKLPDDHRQEPAQKQVEAESPAHDLPVGRDSPAIEPTSQPVDRLGSGSPRPAPPSLFRALPRGRG